MDVLQRLDRSELGAERSAYKDEVPVGPCPSHVRDESRVEPVGDRAVVPDDRSRQCRELGGRVPPLDAEVSEVGRIRNKHAIRVERAMFLLQLTSRCNDCVAFPTESL